MDTQRGRFVEDRVEALDALKRGALEFFKYGEIVQVKTGFFEVVKIRTQGKQRLVLKPVPRPSQEG